MGAFDQLHPAIRHHIVNTLGWQSLRPLQEQAIEPLLAGKHALLIAPTAGGKTEAAIFPILSRMLNEDWRGLTVLYVTPLRALLNNLHDRLTQYASLLGRSVALWHGDTPASRRDQITAEPPDLLLTTPESLESMLISGRVNHDRFFRALHVVVVDEIHAFAGDDRGWHLLALLERVQRLAGCELQRLGLSATVGNPGELLDWLVRRSPTPGVVVAPPSEAPADADVTLDYVGSLGNAATVISRLYRGEKRLVFVDSRARVEQLALQLRNLSIDTYVSHGSLGREERRRAESAFAEGSDCAIVATSTLELGIDVGDLDRVIQIDAPYTVAGFMQRLGRTGRRQDTTRNCLLLATDEDAFLASSGLLRLWSQGYVEPIEAPALPAHLLAQQVMALALQNGGIGRSTWPTWLGRPFVFGDETFALAPRIIDFMLSKEILFEEQGLLSIGLTGEAEFGRRYFSELMSSFTSAPMFSVLHGRTELGQIPDAALELVDQEPRVILLAGSAWAIVHVDWRRRTVHVEPTEQVGKARWFGSGRPLSFEICGEIRSVLTGSQPDVRLTDRAAERLQQLQDAFAWVSPEGTTLARDGNGRVRWWTFGGLLANAWLATALSPLRDQVTQRDNLFVNLAEDVTLDRLRPHLAELEPRALHLGSVIDRAAIAGLKFDACLPESIALEMVERRLAVPEAVEACVEGPVRQAQVDHQQ